ncbi:MAG: hypothetical protein ACTSWY_01460 [Promethearchaeota archaeon]
MKSVQEEKIFGKKCYRFIGDELQLCAVVYFSGKQRLFMRKLYSQSDKVEFEEYIDCIHTAVTDIPIKKFESYNGTGEGQKEIQKKALKIRSSEKLKEIKLSLREKFKAFKSWVAGIAEAGIDAFKIQFDIEENGDLAFPISNRLMRFVTLTDTDIMLEYLAKIERECMFEGERHESSLIANLNFILSNLFFESKELSERDRIILRYIIDIDPPLKLFTGDEHNMLALKYPVTVNLSEFKKVFNSENTKILLNVAQNDRAAEFEKFNRFLSFKTEPKSEIRRFAASNPSAVQFNNFSNFLSETTEPNEEIRMEAAKNINSVKFPEYINFLSYKTEPSIKTRALAAANKQALNLSYYANFLSYKNEPSEFVRSLAAENPNSVIFPKYANFLSYRTEPSIKVREKAAENLNAPQFREFTNFLNFKSEPSEKVRLKAAANPKSVNFSEFSNLIDEKKESSFAVIEVASFNKLSKELKKDFIELNKRICPKCGRLLSKRDRKCRYCAISLPIIL